MVDRRSLLAKSLTTYKSLVGLIEDTLFPLHCLRCQKEGAYICNRCKQTVPPISLQSCPFCSVPTAYGMTCWSDRHKNYLDGLTVRGDYHDWFWHNIIRAWKFGGAREIDVFICQELTTVLPELPHGLYSPLVIPVPLTKRRNRFRGFNQAEVLATRVAEVIEGDLCHEVIRIRETRPQPGLGKISRQKNIKGAFSVTNPQSVRDKDCIVVDDLLTTGATMNEIARILKTAGAKKVWGVSLLRVSL